MFPAKAGTQTFSLKGKFNQGPRQSTGLLRYARNDAVERAVGVIPLTQPSPPEGGEGLPALALSLWERVG